MKEKVMAVLGVLGPLIAREVNIEALTSVIVTQELAQPLSDPLPAVVAAADRVFPDPITRTFIVGLLSRHPQVLVPAAR